MDNYFNFRSGSPKVNWYLRIVILGYFISFILSTLIYFIIHNKLIILEEKDPDIDLSGIKDIRFITSNKRQEYRPEVTNLGETGELILDCYTGYCIAWTDIYYESTRKVASYDCSQKCSGIKDRCTCYDVYLKEKFSGCSFKENDKYSRAKFCYVYNLIFYWKEKLYEIDKVVGEKSYDGSSYSYINNAVKANESCPKGRRMCGILDNLGNKLCYPPYYECPINYITKDIKDDNISDYNELNINGNKYYYTNKKTETGKVLGGLFADTDLLPKYGEEDCEILETDTISSFLKSNGHYLYINSLNFNPNNNSNVDRLGKAYLKWCVPGVGKNKNIDFIKKKKKEYDNNVTNNKNCIKPIKNKVDKYYFITLPGYILVFLNLVVSTFCYWFNKINESSEINRCQCAANCYEKESFFFVITMVFCISWIFLIISLFLSIKPLYYLVLGLGSQFINHLITILIVLYIVYICLNISIIIIFCFFFDYLNKNNILK